VHTNRRNIFAVRGTIKETAGRQNCVTGLNIISENMRRTYEEQSLNRSIPVWCSGSGRVPCVHYFVRLLRMASLCSRRGNRSINIVCINHDEEVGMRVELNKTKYSIVAENEEDLKVLNVIRFYCFWCKVSYAGAEEKDGMLKLNFEAKPLDS